MKVPCQACGHQNELGRIFCTQCGKKLDMSQMSMAHVSRQTNPLAVGAIFKILGSLLLVATVLVAGLALWPRAALQEGAPSGSAGRVRTQLSGAQNAVRAGTEITVDFAVRDLNAYLHQHAARHGLQSLTAEILPGAMVVRAVDEWGPWDIGAYRLGPLRYSYDIRCVPAGSTYRIAKAAFGHLPLPGSLAFIARDRMAAVFSEGHEKALLSNLEKIEFETDLLKASFRP